MHVAIDSLVQRSQTSWRMSCHPVFDDGTCGEREFHTIKATRRRDAKRAMDELRASLEDELRREEAQGAQRAGITLGQWQTRHVEELYATGVIGKSSVASYRSSLSRCKALADMDLAEIDRQAATDALREMMLGGEHSPGVIAKDFRMLRASLDRAVGEGLIARNPLSGLRLPKAQPTRTRALTASEKQTLVRVMRNVREPVRSFIGMGLMLGVRGEEACGFRWADRDRRACRPTIAVEGVVIVEDGRPRVKEPKTAASRRKIPEPATLTAMLDARREQQERKCEQAGVRFSEGFFILGDIDGLPPDPDGMRKRFRDVCDGAGLPCTYHWLRHTLATHLISEGVDPRTVAGWLGHSDPGFTLRVYCDVNPQALMDSADVAEGIVGL